MNPKLRKKRTRRTYIPATTDFGMILEGDRVTLVKRVKKEWYQVQIPDGKNNPLATFMEPGLYRELIAAIYRAIPHVAAASTLADTAEYERQAIELYIIR
jgi:hypothetical protein